ncbi:Hypothetical protein SCLAV_p0141 (plasmid) [Streptomyces clavuligerus]|uniref:Uncharacterized protein n=1 Tax=Streptomyces clavuligerus TaxID=1901 RepID=D5SI89_STRCL|nr:Hypothetical protein SCLAV_p0141 [Streptomyces clavuligerus]
MDGGLARPRRDADRDTSRVARLTSGAGRAARNVTGGPLRPRSAACAEHLGACVRSAPAPPTG